MDQNFEIYMHKDYLESLFSLPHTKGKKAQELSQRMIDNPWRKEMHYEKIRDADPGMYSSRVDRNYRIIWKHIKPNSILFCFIEKHDEAYRRAAATTFLLEDGVVIKETQARERQSSEPAFGLLGYNAENDQKLGELFLGYKDEELIEMGVPEEVLPNVRALDYEEQIWNIQRLLPEDVFDQLLDILTRTETGKSDGTVVPDEQLRKSLERNQGGEDIYKFIGSQEFQRALQGDMEDWMLFLAPHQRRIVNRDYAGPARVKGVVGSGKTVVAIHRLVRLARQAKGTGRKVLFLTYGNRLPDVIQYLANMLAGDDRQLINSYECKTISSWCGTLLRRHNHQIRIDSRKIDQALRQAVSDVKRKTPSYSIWNKRLSFFQDEIRYSIKGRAVSSLEEYLALDRSGRGTGLNDDERRAMYQVYQTYQKNLGEGYGDWQDLILRSLELVRNGKTSGSYSAVVLDEIQDLTAAVMQLVREIVPEKENDLFMVGDGLQRIYPGGYVLGRLGIDIVGRGTLLKKNYRNTKQILLAAHAMMEGETYDDMEVQNAPVIPPEFSVRSGEKPYLHRASSLNEEVAWVGERVQGLIENGRFTEDDFAFLYRYRNPYQNLLINEFAGRKIRLVEIDQKPTAYFGPGAKHTTYHSSKGLEFKVVFVLGVTDSKFVPKDDWSLEGQELEEYLAREKRLLYVAMTRARDLLYLTYSRGTKSRFLADIPEELIS